MKGTVHRLRSHPFYVMENEYHTAYLAGVLAGDGYVDYGNKNPRLCLMVTSEPFAKLFAESLTQCGFISAMSNRIKISQIHNIKGFLQFSSYCYLARATVPNSFIRTLQSLNPTSEVQKIGYLKGFFDSEGTYHFDQNYVTKGCQRWQGKCWKNGHRKNIRIFNKDMNKLAKVREILSSFGISNNLLLSKGNITQDLYYLSIQRSASIDHFLELTNGKFGVVDFA